MEAVGEFFKQVRETKGLTIDEVASKTRIRTDFLKALEDGNFAKLPDQVFAKGFVRTYARSLGLDEEDAIHRFTESAGAFYDKQEERERLRVRQAEDERRRRTNRKTLVLGLGVAVLLLILLLTREQSSILFSRPAPVPPPLALQEPIPILPSPEVAPPDEEETTPADQVTTGSEEGARATPAEPLVSPAPSASVTPDRVMIQEPSGVQANMPDDPLSGQAVQSPLVLDLEALELTWVVVQIDGGSPHEALLRAGERVTWKGNNQFTLTLGNAGGVRVELNGEPKGPFGPSGSVARDIVLKLEG